MQNDRRDTCGKIIVYHGSPNAVVKPAYGLGEERHDYGRGFYTTESSELAKEWAVCNGNDVGYVHKYMLDMNGLNIFDFNNVNAMCWMAELMKHRDADSSVRYKRMSKEFIVKFGIDISAYDVIIGWRADSSYFSIAKRFVRNEIDYCLISELFHLGKLDNQICLKSKKAFSQVFELEEPEKVGIEYSQKYNDRDRKARDEMNRLIESTRNTMKKGFDYVMEADFKL